LNGRDWNATGHRRKMNKFSGFTVAYWDASATDTKMVPIRPLVNKPFACGENASSPSR
jgi:hypothetical protein